MAAENLQLLEVQDIEPKIREALIDLLTDTVDNGASVGFLSPLAREEASRYWDGVIGDDVILLLAMKDGKVAGTVQLHLAMKENGLHRAEVAKLMVHTSYRRQGIARVLMEAIENAAKARGRRLLVLDTRAGDPSNLLYRSLGYVAVGEIPKFAMSSDGSYDATVIYYKEI